MKKITERPVPQKTITIFFVYGDTDRVLYYMHSLTHSKRKIEFLQWYHLQLVSRLKKKSGF